MPDEIREQLADWIEAMPIVETILDVLDANEIEPNLPNAKSVWLDVLYTELGNAIRRTVAALARKDSFVTIEPDELKV